MAAPLLLKGIPLLRLRLPRYNRLTVGIISAPRRPWCVAADSAGQEEEASSVEKSSAVLSVRDPPKYHRWDDPDYRKWKDKEEEILRDIEPIISLAKEILHSDRYMDGERLTVADEETVVEKLLRHHPHSEDKIGCGLDSIMVDRHPLFRHSRCLFVVRTDGGWIDFSYQKCLRAYIRDKYPSHAERFIRERFKRVSG
ncbi:protein DCL homolog, chloroplastic-like isoform X1 [Durio zibethinus]|uniref:Protein DCL homolog, chloroplastic-like isoform X1 n=1 Tax=Durio zibethinus TaxID=66656 RepID=A0A6P6AV81_DURZI|nr:protein DCL homolog, chloroplastic-like isoform X1 [Durio zibethinus]